MNKARPEQAILSRDTDISKTDETKAVIEGMVDGLNDHRINAVSYTHLTLPTTPYV